METSPYAPHIDASLLALAPALLGICKLLVLNTATDLQQEVYLSLPALRLAATAARAVAQHARRLERHAKQLLVVNLAHIDIRELHRPTLRALIFAEAAALQKEEGR